MKLKSIITDTKIADDTKLAIVTGKAYQYLLNQDADESKINH